MSLVLVAFFAIFCLSFKYLSLNINIKVTQFSFFLILPLSQVYLAYKGMLDVMKLDGLTKSERDRLTSTVDTRRKSSLYVVILFILISFAMYILDGINIVANKYILASILSIGLTSILSCFLAWTDLHEISVLEKELKSRKESREAKSKVLSNK